MLDHHTELGDLGLHPLASPPPPTPPLSPTGDPLSPTRSIRFSDELPDALQLPPPALAHPSATTHADRRTLSRHYPYDHDLNAPSIASIPLSDLAAPRDAFTPGRHLDDDDEPPMQGSPPMHPLRRPHPLYTPAPKRHRRRGRHHHHHHRRHHSRRGSRRSKSVASSSGRKSKKGAAGVVRKVTSAKFWRHVLIGKPSKHRPSSTHSRRSASSNASSYSSSTSSSSSSSSSSSDSRSSSSLESDTNASNSSGSSRSHSTKSSSTWHHGWRFWRNSSSGSTRSSSSSSGGSDRSWDPPEPHFTLFTPILSRRPPPSSSHNNNNNTSSEEEEEDAAHSATPPDRDQQQQQQQAYPDHLHPGGLPPPTRAFELSNFQTLTPALARLEEFWKERREEDGISGDLGEGRGMGLGAEEERGLGEGGMEEGFGERNDEPFGTQQQQGQEAKRGGGSWGEEGPSWWLDVMCPSVADMRELRKLIPLHPLTMEDIMHQETREKIEPFSALGYYFIVFRALDETYFRYTSDESSSLPEGGEGQGDGLGEQRRKRKGRVEMIENVGIKEGVEGVGVGAVNLYLAVFADGIISFHFEDISKHAERVQGKLQQVGLSRTISSHWIAYGLMDSIVDAFFPLIDFIEAESKDVDAFLSDPLASPSSPSSSPYPSSFPHPYLSPQSSHSYPPYAYDESDLTGIQVDHLSSTTSLKRASRPTLTFSHLRGLPGLRFSPIVLKVLPTSWVTTSLPPPPPSCTATGGKETPYETLVAFAQQGGVVGFGPVPEKVDQKDSTLTSSSLDQKGKKGPASPPSRGVGVGGGLAGQQHISMASPTFDRLDVLKRIADARKLVTGLSRLLGPKRDVVTGFRRRTKEDLGRRRVGRRQGGEMGGEGGGGVFERMKGRRDISIYMGDLFDHIATMQQSLNFYDAILSHDHPAYLGILRLALSSAKSGTDVALVKLYIVTLTFLPINILTGIFSSNVHQPHNGTEAARWLNADGTRAAHTGFFLVLGGVVLTALSTWAVVWAIFKTANKQRKRRGKILD